MRFPIIFTSLIAFLVAACATPTITEPLAGHLRADNVKIAQESIPQPVRQSLSSARPKHGDRTETYSVVVNNVKVHDLLFALARDAALNVDIHPGIAGHVTLNAIDQTLPQLLSRIARQVDMRFELDGGKLSVMPDLPYLRTYQVDYLNMAREVSGTVATNTQIVTSAATGATGTGGSPSASNASRIRIENTSKNRFWESLEKNIKDLLQDSDRERIVARRTAEASEANNRATNLHTTAAGNGAAAGAAGVGGVSAAGAGNQSVESRAGATTQAQRQQDYKDYETIFATAVITNVETGVLSVRATSRQHEKIREFLDHVMSNARRQVLIEATIVEVELSDGFQQGIEWNRLRADGSGFSLGKPSLGTNVTNALTPFVFKYADKSNPLNLLASVNLLESFGSIKVLSSPKLSVLNNQTATLKVSEEFVYFSVKADTTISANVGTVTTVSTTPQSVSVGFFMSVTPQISDTGAISLNIRPSISSISDLKRDPNPSIPADIPNYVPQIRTREIESLLRIESGEIAVLGGLMEDRVDNKTGRIPGVGALPLLGELFNSRSNTARKSELVIFLRPTVLTDASLAGDFQHFRNALPGRSHFSPDPAFQPLSGIPATTEALQ